MLRSLLPILAVGALVAASGACSPAEPPLLIDGGQPPASNLSHQSPGGDNRAVSR